MHLPPWQFEEQHSVFAAQASPRVLHEVPPESGGRAWQVVEQLPVQHSPAAPQAVPVALHSVLAHRPPTHESEQQSPAPRQEAPGVLQKAVVVHRPAPGAWVGLSHAPEQHSPFALQVAAGALQVETGAAHCWVAGLQYPSQQVASEAQLNPFALQDGAVAQNLVGSQ